MGVDRFCLCSRFALLDCSSPTTLAGATGGRALDSECLELDNPIFAGLDRSTCLRFLEKTTVVLFETHQFNRLIKHLFNIIKFLNCDFYGIVIACLWSSGLAVTFAQAVEHEGGFR